MLIRRETPNDVDAIRSIIEAAFVRPERQGRLPPEVTLIEELRASNDWLPALSLVAVNSDGDVAGHVLCTRGRVDSAAVLALGPLAVEPDLNDVYRPTLLDVYRPSRRRAIRGHYIKRQKSYANV
jgi:putative acetyltransferase